MMKLAKHLVLALTALMLTACNASTVSIKPVISHPDRELTRACLRPVRLPPGEMLQEDIERLWRRDRAALIKCGLTKAAVVWYYRDLANRLQGKKPVPKPAVLDELTDWSDKN